MCKKVRQISVWDNLDSLTSVKYRCRQFAVFSAFRIKIIRVKFCGGRELVWISSSHCWQTPTLSYQVRRARFLLCRSGCVEPHCISVMTIVDVIHHHHHHHPHHMTGLTWCRHSSASGPRYKVSVTHFASVRKSWKTDTSSTLYGMMSRLALTWRISVRAFHHLLPTYDIQHIYAYARLDWNRAIWSCSDVRWKILCSCPLYLV